MNKEHIQSEKKQKSKGDTYYSHESQEIPCMKIIITDIVENQTIRLIELESKDYYFKNVAEGMKFLIRKHDKIFKNLHHSEKHIDKSVG